MIMGAGAILEEEQEEDQENQGDYELIEEEEKMLLVNKEQPNCDEEDPTSVKTSLYYKMKLLKFIKRSKEVEEDIYVSNFRADNAKAPCIYHVIIFRQFSDRYPCCECLLDKDTHYT
eukprot:TRINITY_DN18442_c0_g1_i1.p1 TRINITY_DN18442_c0_g1~~TRINITY_DN18442_c0_g1_i1.p1  ORF type:complete len:117 (-),score=26.43 TRINITY_DN18442_c0_g1_i1:178-528(-)